MLNRREFLLRGSVFSLAGCSSSVFIDKMLPPVAEYEMTETSLRYVIQEVVQNGRKRIERIGVPMAISATTHFSRATYSKRSNVGLFMSSINVAEVSPPPDKTSIFFQSRQYDPRNGLGNQQLVRMTSDFLSYIATNANVRQKRIQLECYGGADGRKLSTCIDRYDQKISGQINAKFLVNSQQKLIKIDHDQCFNNWELAFLRAYSTYFALREQVILLQKISLTRDVKFWITEHKALQMQDGPRLRYARITIKIPEVVSA